LMFQDKRRDDAHVYIGTQVGRCWRVGKPKHKA